MKKFLLSMVLFWLSLSTEAAETEQTLLANRTKAARMQQSFTEAQIIARLIDERHDISEMERTDPQLFINKASCVADKLLQMRLPEHVATRYSSFTNFQDPQLSEPCKILKRYQLFLRKLHKKNEADRVDVCASYELCTCGRTVLASKEYSLKINNGRSSNKNVSAFAKKAGEESLRLLVLPKSNGDMARLQIYRVALVP